jgi:hypothetical protein
VFRFASDGSRSSRRDDLKNTKERQESSIAGHIPLWFAEQEMNMLRHNYIPINLKPEAAPPVLHPKIAHFAILGWDVPP